MPEKTFKVLKPPRKVGDAYEYGSLVFWAEGGGIYCEDSEPSKEDRIAMAVRGQNPHNASYVKPITLPAWQQRLAQYKRILADQEKTSHIVRVVQDAAVFSNTCWTLREIIRMMQDLERQALEQGDLTKPGTQRYYALHEATRRRQFVVSEKIDTAGVCLPD